MSLITLNAKTNSISNPDFQGASAGFFTPGSVATISCNPNDEWEISAGGIHECNADGVEGAPFIFKEQSYRAGAMVGSFDGGNTFFPVGVNTEVRVLSPGTRDNAELTLYCWDSDWANNSGNIAATVEGAV